MDQAEARYAVADNSQAIGSYGNLQTRHSVAARQPLSPSNDSTRNAWDTALWLGAGLTHSHDSGRTSCSSAQNKYSQCVWWEKIPRRDPGLACDFRAACVLLSRSHLGTWDASGSSIQWPVWREPMSLQFCMYCVWMWHLVLYPTRIKYIDRVWNQNAE